ncbi:MAG: glycosyltransferase family 2 protein [Bacteroidetes bacterium]|nr:glycosyltransferase family 2 protein [Bacteroidota bacterium]
MSQISILMPVRNAGLFLESTLESILDQCFNDWELLMVDDHSEDDSKSIMEHYMSKDDRIILLKNQGKGIIPALRTAYEASSSPMVTRMDADDLMTADKLQDLQAVCRPGHVATAKVSYFREDAPLADGFQRYAEWLNTLIDEKGHWQEIYKECVIPSPCWMMHREDLESIGAFDHDSYPEDYDLVFRMYEAGFKVAGVNKVLHHWRDHSERASRTDPNYQDNRFPQLKIRYYLKCDHLADHPLVLWGAGAKGKALAKLLLEEGTSFTWVTDNAKKWNAPIHGKPLTSPEQIQPKSQCIIAIAGETHQREIKKQLVLSDVSTIHFFC